MPCYYDELLRTETLSGDWAALLHKYPGLPQVALPRVNEAGAAIRHHPWGSPPPAVYTPQLRSLVRQMDRWVFDRFGYSMDEPSPSLYPWWHP